ncbi:MAG: hypothetical protein LLG42_01150 [Chloroflexi bacterium]|nr:hypothetical protein [Chloroflexota bacterium]
MAIKRLVETKELKFNSIRKIVMEHEADLQFDYDKRFDALILRWFIPEGQFIVHYIDDNVGLLYEEKSKEIVGLQIEAFEHKFLKEHSDINKIWKLSDQVHEFEDFGDIMISCRQMKPVIADKVGEIADDLLSSSGKIPDYSYAD